MEGLAEVRRGHRVPVRHSETVMTLNVDAALGQTFHYNSWAAGRG